MAPSPGSSQPRLATIHQSISEQLHRRLRDAIIRGDLPPGRALSEAEVGRYYAVSRQPVREAFIKLAEEHLLEVVPNRGTQVRKIFMREVLDARFVREAVEVAIVREAATRPPPVDVATLRRLLDLQRVVPADDGKAFLGLDDDFHRALAIVAGREFAWHAIEGLKAQMDRARYLSLDHATPIARLVEQHEAIVDAIERQAPESAETAMRAHLQEIEKSLPGIAAEHAAAFSTDE